MSPRKKTVSPDEAAERATAQLEALADEEVAARGRSFFKRGARVVLYGVRAPQVRQLVREMHRDLAGRWTVAEATKCCDILIRRRQLEAKVFGVLLLGRYRREFAKPLLPVIQSWIARGQCDNWAIIDALCPALLTPLVDCFPDLIPRVTRWARSSNQWLRRAAVVTFVPLARKGRQLDVAYETVQSLFQDGEDLMHKACGWLLREAGKTDLARLERFLLEHGPAMPRTTVRYAIERFPAARRRRLLTATRKILGEAAPDGPG